MSSISCGVDAVNLPVAGSSPAGEQDRTGSFERGCLFYGAPDRAHPLGGESPLLARQGEQLAGRQGCPSRGGIRRKPQAKRWPDEQELHRGSHEGREGHVSSKSSTCTELMEVYAAGISVKVGAHYSGRSVHLLDELLLPRGEGTGGQKSAEGIVGVDQRRRPEHELGGREPEFRWRRRGRVVMAEMPDPIPESSGRNPRGQGVGASNAAARKDETRPAEQSLMEEVVESKNMQEAYRKVMGNRGAAGIDEMAVEELKPYLKTEWPAIKETLLGDHYRPRPVRRVEIPKPGGKGVRKLGHPDGGGSIDSASDAAGAGPDRDPGFSESSYGFRQGGSRIRRCRRPATTSGQATDWVVDLDLEKFFDRVNHDVLMSRVARRVSDKRMLKLIRGFLNSGAMENGLVGPTEKERRKADPCRRFFPICCSTIWTESWSNADTASFATQTTVRHART